MIETGAGHLSSLLPRGEWGKGRLTGWKGDLRTSSTRQLCGIDRDLSFLFERLGAFGKVDR